MKKIMMRYQYGEQSTKFFLSLEKKRAIGGTVKKLLNYNTETSNATENNYYSNIYERIPLKKCNKK